MTETMKATADIKNRFFCAKSSPLYRVVPAQEKGFFKMVLTQTKPCY
ncbi:MAG: hypothetical protein ABSC89_04820 [Verrucomicrobiota bacterium]|jgi:hypothetical protein